MDDHRFSAISQYSDSPSVYARPYFSPDSVYDYPSPVSAGPPPRHHVPASMLDLADDPRASYSQDDHEHSAYVDNDAHVDDAAPAARLSYLGPKMRFHSRAPWEMDGDPLDEDEEADDARHLASGLPFARAKPGSSSPRPSFQQAARPSGESSRSHIPPKRSFETINSQISYPRGALYTLAHESMSATSLSRPRDTLRSKFSLGRLRPDTPSGSLPPPPLPPPSPARSRFQSSPPPFENTTTAPAHEPMHPYANPDNIAAYADDERTSFPNSLYAPSRNDSSMTVTETFSGDSLTRASASARSATAPTLTSDPSIGSLSARSRGAAVLAKNISAPVPVAAPVELAAAAERSLEHQRYPHGLPPGASLPGWHERGITPAFSLISLEEARAQRMRSATTAGDVLRTSGSGSSGGLQGFTSATLDDSETASITTDGSPFGNLASRARGRSISAGAKSALHTIVGQPKGEHRKDSEASFSPAGTTAGKSLKHKKSGFMRLFNAGKTQDREDREREDAPPPPVPALPEHAQLRPGAKAGVQRIPVPSLSPSLAAAAEAHSADDGTWSTSVLSRSPPKRTLPTLSITTVASRAGEQTQTQPQPLALSTSAAHAQSRPWAAADQLPQSAPAHVSAFPALRLRPVSTLFSAHFGEHIVPLDDDDAHEPEDGGPGGARSSGDTDADAPESALDTPRSTSPGALISPLLRASGEHVAIVSPGVGSDGGAIGAALQLGATKPTAAQRQIWELEGRVRDLQTELQELRGKNGGAFCVHCGRGTKKADTLGPVSVVNRPRARTGTSSRFGSTLP